MILRGKRERLRSHEVVISWSQSGQNSNRLKCIKVQGYAKVFQLSLSRRIMARQHSPLADWPNSSSVCRIETLVGKSHHLAKHSSSYCSAELASE